MDREGVDREWRSDWTGTGTGTGREGAERLWRTSTGRLKPTESWVKDTCLGRFGAGDKAWVRSKGEWQRLEG